MTRPFCCFAYSVVLMGVLTNAIQAQTMNFGPVAVGQSSTGTDLTLTLPFTATSFEIQNASEFPALNFIPLTSVYSVAYSPTTGDAVVIGASTLDLFYNVRQIPAASISNEQFCSTVQLAPNRFYRAFVPTAAEQAGDFSNFDGPIIDPLSGQPFPGNIIPTSLLGGILAWRVSTSSSSTTNSLTCRASFAPRHPGLRQGALIATDGSGHSTAAFLSGTGIAAQVEFTPGVTSITNTGPSGYSGVAVDTTGNIYIVNRDQCVVGKLNSSTGLLSAIAGNGVCASTDSVGDNGPATSAGLKNPKGIAFDAAGDLYIADDAVVREVNAATGAITTVAGNGMSGADSGDGGLATSAVLSDPQGLAVDIAGNLYIAETHTEPPNFAGGGEVRKVDATTHVITRVAGTGTSGFSGGNGQAVNAQLGDSSGIVVDPAGNLYVADPTDAVVWKVNQSTGIVTVFAGIGNSHSSSGDGGPAASAQLNGPMGLALDASGNLFIADSKASVVRAVDASTGTITTVAGNGASGYTGDGSLATNTGFGSLEEGPGVLALDASGNLYICSTLNSTGKIFAIAQSTTFLNFPSTSPGSSSLPQSFTLWNTGTDTLYITPPFVLGGPNSADYSAQTSCGTVIAPGVNCVTSLTFSPTSTGAAADTAGITITDTAPNSPQTISVTSPLMKIFIDIPGSQSAPFLGVAAFSGWAIDNAAAIANLGVLVDDAPVGMASYGTNRPDVCAAYQDQIDCPNVGWTFNLDTTKLVSGTHKLTVIATSSTGEHATTNSSFTVANWMPLAADPVHLDIDRPSSSDTAFTGIAPFAGWAIDDTGSINNVTIAVDGVEAGNAVYGGARNDVCAVYPNRAGCPNVGWSFALDTTLLADGRHTLAVSAGSSGGAQTTITSSFTVANRTPQNPIRLYIDRPNSQTGVLSGSIPLAGWAIDDNTAIAGVSLSIDGVFFGNATYGVSRGDVCAVYPNRAGCPNVGWTFLLDTTLLANGTHALEITALTADGEHATLATSFAVSNSAIGNPTRIFVDQPNGSSSVLFGVTPLSGWAINDNAAIGTVGIFVDGNSYGNAHYGVSRQDVCSAYPGRSGCPDVGWTFILDTTSLSNGAHTLTVSATAINGEHWVVSTTFTVENWTAAANPFHIVIDAPNAQSAPLAGASVTLAGWALNDNAAIDSVAISVDGVALGSGSYGVSRPDVCNVFPNRLGCPNVGWNFVLDTTVLADGPHILNVTATSGAQAYTTSGSFAVANLSPAGPIRVFIDRPNGQSTQFSGTAALGGWAISDNAAITGVVIAVDGISIGNAVYGGNRPDVCAAFPNRAGCPAVGWNFVLDTTPFANGNHTLEITATAADGQRATQSTSFVVSN